MKNLLKKLIGGGLTRIIIISFLATLACVGIIKAATTIGNNISTGGTLDVSGVSTLTGNTNIAGSLTSLGANAFYGAMSIGGALTATSTLSVTGLTIFDSNVGIGTSSPYAKLSVVGEAVATYFTATSTTATSTFTNLITTGTLNGSYTTTVANLSSTINSAPTGSIVYVKNESASVNQINITNKTNLIIDGQGATLTLNNGTNGAIFYISGGSRITIRNFNFVGPNTGTYNSTNKHRGIVVTGDASHVVIENSSFSGFDSQGIFSDNVGGSFDTNGVIISKCVFKDFLYDSATDEQAGVYLGGDGEYTTIRDNYFTNIPAAIRSFTGNVNIISNTITMSNASVTSAPSATKGLIYVYPGNNNGKHKIINNVINHNGYNVIPLQLYGDALYPQNSFTVTDNHILLNANATGGAGTYQQIRATEVDNSVFANNTMRSNEELTAVEAVVEIIDSDNVQLTGNHIMNGTYGIKATANTSKTTSLNLNNNVIRNYTTADVVTSGSGIATIGPKLQKQFISQTLDILSSSATDLKLLFSPISGNTGTDYSSYAHAATVTGYTTANVSQDGLGYSITGGSGKYFTFADADEFSFSGTTDSAFSVGGFFNLASENTIMLIAKEDSPDAAPEWSLYIPSSNKIVMLLMDRNPSMSKIGQVSTASYTPGKHCIVSTYDGSATAGGIKIYVDGLLFASAPYAAGSYAAMENLGTAVSVNAFPDGTWNRTGTTAQAFIVGRELSANDVMAYCAAGGALGY